PERSVVSTPAISAAETGAVRSINLRIARISLLSSEPVRCSIAICTSFGIVLNATRKYVDGSSCLTRARTAGPCAVQSSSSLGVVQPEDRYAVLGCPGLQRRPCDVIAFVGVLRSVARRLNPLENVNDRKARQLHRLPPDLQFVDESLIELRSFRHPFQPRKIRQPVGMCEQRLDSVLNAPRTVLQ